MQTIRLWTTSGMNNMQGYTEHEVQKKICILQINFTLKSNTRNNKTLKFSQYECLLLWLIVELSWNENTCTYAYIVTVTKTRKIENPKVLIIKKKKTTFTPNFPSNPSCCTLKDIIDFTRMRYKRIRLLHIFSLLIPNCTYKLVVLLVDVNVSQVLKSKSLRKLLLSDRKLFWAIHIDFTTLKYSVC